MTQDERWQKRYNEDEGPEKQTANGYGDSGFVVSFLRGDLMVLIC